jgi:lipid-A-disaccharide synthase
VERIRPDVIVTIDSPGFCKRMIDRLSSWDIPRVHYVAPTVWAWRPKRVHAFKARFDRLLTLLPFEPPYFEKVGLRADFVGHPVLESRAEAGNGPGFRSRHDIEAERPLFCLLPGSRGGEVQRLMPILAETAQRIHGRVDDAAFVMPCVPAMMDRIRDAIAGWPEAVRPILVGTAEKYDAMAASNVAVAASGTVALELAQARLPTVIGYRINALTYKLVRAISDIPHVHLLNILAQRRIVPELLQEDCSPESLSAHAIDLLGDAGSRQIAELTPYLEDLKVPGLRPSEAAARAVLDEVARHKAQRKSS